jgi:ribosome-binding factor A
MSIRQEKFGKVIQKELSEVFQANRSELLNNAFITISKVEVSPDLGYAKIFVSLFNGKNTDEMMSILELQKKAIRHELAQRIRKQVRVIPELNFIYDDSLDYVFRMEKVFQEIKKNDDTHKTT